MDIWEKLNLDPARHRTVALVGAGGKTTTLYALARQARDGGRTVVVTTTTHIRRHPRLPLTDGADGAAVRTLLERYGVITAGTVFQGDKLSAPADVAALARAADVVLVEADGARMLPLKAPAEHEPVLPACADAVVAVAGMDCVGRPVEEVCHRPQRVRALLAVGEGHLLTPADVARILTSPKGGHKGVGEAVAFRCVLNKADTPARLAHARDAAAELARRGIHSAITHYTGEERGGLCWF